MFKKLIKHHCSYTYDSGEEVHRLFSGIVGSALGVFAIMVASQYLTPSYLIICLLSIMLVLFVLSGFSKYEDDGYRKFAFGGVLLWPLALGFLATYWSIYAIIKLITGIYNIHGSISNIKMPSLPKRKPKPMKNMDETVPKTGAYRDNAESCKACGKLI